MKRYKVQALVTLAPARDRGPTAVLDDNMRRMVVRAHHHESGATRLFSALVRRSSERPPWPDDSPVIATIVLVGERPGEYFDIGDTFTLWLGRDLGNGVVTRHLFV
jgi:hypothetical protein